MHEKEVHILPREKERKVGARFSVSSLEFLPGVQEVRK